MPESLVGDPHSPSDATQPGPDNSSDSSTDLLSAVRGKYLDMSRSDKKIARFLLDSPEAFITRSVADVAGVAQVSEATVVRFGRALGCAGFRDFKITLAQHLAARQAKLDARIEAEEEGDGSYIDRICGAAFKSLREAVSNLHIEAVESAAQMVRSANRISIFGLGGSSSVLAEELHFRLFRLGISSAHYLDTYAQRMSASTLASGDLAVFVSSTGRPQTLIEIAELARHYGASTLAITERESILAGEVDVCLDVHLTQVGVSLLQPNPMRYAQLLVIDCLAYRVATLLEDTGKRYLERVRASIASVHGIAPQQPIGD